MIKENNSMPKIVSFGDSFIFGSEIENNTFGNMGWPGIASKTLETDFECQAVPGTSNDSIARRIFSYYQKHPNNDLAVINWTWIMRWDYFLPKEREWESLGVGKFCLSKAHSEKQYKKLTDLYHKYIIDNQMFNKWNNLKTIYSVNMFLENQNIPHLQTYMDHELVENEWFNEDYLLHIKDACKNNLFDFDGLNFLDWSKKNGFEITNPGWHPLEDAHVAAAEYWLSTYKQLLNLN